MKSAIEDYLRTMYSIFEKKHSELDEKTRKVSKKASDVNKKTKAVKDVNKKVKAVDIAKELKISRASVSAMVKKLAKMKYVDANLYSKISMTKKGEKEARRIMHNHRVIEVFLTDVLGYDLKKVHNEAHRLEHAFSESSIRKLDEFLGNPTISPFGKRIHTKKMKTTIICDSGAGNHKHPVCIKLHDKKSEGRLQVQSQEKQKHIVPLPLLKKNQKGTISHICGDSIIVQRLSDLGLTPMSKIMLVRKMMHNGPIEITVRRTTLAIDRNIANNIFINLDL